MPSPSAGFSQLTYLDLSRNWLSGVLPPSLASLPLAATCGLSLWDNGLEGTLPESYVGAAHPRLMTATRLALVTSMVF